MDPFGTAKEREALTVKVKEAEAAMAGTQLTWASTPKDVPTIRRRGILVSAVLGPRRQYGFDNEHNREQFVYDRNDTLFTVSRDIRDALGLSGPIFRGTVAVPLPPEARAPRKNKFRK